MGAAVATTNVAALMAAAAAARADEGSSTGRDASADAGAGAEDRGVAKREDRAEKKLARVPGADDEEEPSTRG